MQLKDKGNETMYQRNELVGAQFGGARYTDFALIPASGARGGGGGGDHNLKFKVNRNFAQVLKEVRWGGGGAESEI